MFPSSSQCLACLRNEWDLLVLVRLDGGSLKCERVDEEATAVVVVVVVGWEKMSERLRFSFGVGLGCVGLSGFGADAEGAARRFK